MTSTETTETTTIGSALAAAIETFWAAVAERHPELPRRVVAITGRGRMLGGIRLGHMSLDKPWQAGEESLAELFVAGETFHRGGRSVAKTILHEAAHLLLLTRGDETGGTSRQGRYHTAKGFGAAAEELGLVMPAKADPTLGFSDCTMPDATAERYADAIAALDAAIGARIAWTTPEELASAAVAIGAILGGFQVIVPWWLDQDQGLAGIWGALGGGIRPTKAARAPRRARVRLACSCRSITVNPDDVDLYEDLECKRCAGTLEVQ